MNGSSEMMEMENPIGCQQQRVVKRRESLYIHGGGDGGEGF